MRSPTKPSPSSFALVVTAFSLVAPAAPARADVIFTIAFDDPAGELLPHQANLHSHLAAAGAAWAARLPGSATLSIRVRPTTAVQYSSGYSYTSAFVGTSGGFNIIEQGAAAHIRTGQNVSPGNPDIEFIINPAYITDELWFDPDPFSRAAPMPPDRTDAMSVCLHELGHALAYNGWMDGFDGSLPGDYKSPFDRLVTFDGDDFYFTGPAAVALSGGPVPVTFGNPFHFGNNPPRPGSELVPQLMNGVVFTDGQRYSISELDWAVLADVGIAVLPPLTACLADIAGGGPDGLEPDGIIDGSDFVAFINAFAAGC